MFVQRKLDAQKTGEDLATINAEDAHWEWGKKAMVAVLDPLLKAYIEGLASPEQLITAGSEPDLALRVHQLLRRAEFKRRQAAPTLKVSGRAFGGGWRMPIAAA